MKKLLFISICFVLNHFAHAQTKAIPAQYLADIENQAGLWIADNSEFQNANEPADKYAIEWKLSPIGNSIVGRLYGLKNQEEIGNYWDFIKYWDPEKGKVVVLQIGPDGTIGRGELKYLDKNVSELIQVFTNPDGISYKVGHRSHFPTNDMEIGSSFNISNSGEWLAQRTYTWIRQN
jgi:hypothetical protein